jgi:hypothetical protein
MSCLCYVYLIIYRERTKASREGKGEGTDRPGREKTRARNANDLFARSSPLFLFRLWSPPSTPSPRVREGRPPRPVLAMPSPPPRHRSTSKQQRQGSASTVCHPPRLVLFPVSLPLLQVVRAGQRVSQGGRFLPAHHADPLHPAGGRQNIPC